MCVFLLILCLWSFSKKVVCLNPESESAQKTLQNEVVRSQKEACIKVVSWTFFGWRGLLFVESLHDNDLSEPGIWIDTKKRCRMKWSEAQKKPEKVVSWPPCSAGSSSDNFCCLHKSSNGLVSRVPKWKSSLHCSSSGSSSISNS